MEPWLIALILKPLAAFVLLFAGAVLARALLKLLPEGRLKRLLSISWTP